MDVTLIIVGCFKNYVCKYEAKCEINCQMKAAKSLRNEQATKKLSLEFAAKIATLPLAMHWM